MIVLGCNRIEIIIKGCDNNVIELVWEKQGI